MRRCVDMHLLQFGRKKKTKRNLPAHETQGEAAQGEEVEEDEDEEDGDISKYKLDSDEVWFTCDSWSKNNLALPFTNENAFHA